MATPAPRKGIPPRFTSGQISKQPQPPAIKRPPAGVLTSLLQPDRVKRLELPHGCFNAGLINDPLTGGYICVYRPDERSFSLCLLTGDLQIVPGSHRPLGITNCADPRLAWWGHRLLMVYSSHDTGTYKNECIRAAVLAEYAQGPGASMKWLPVEPFRVSMPGEARQKNWTPFVGAGNRLFLVASIRPHTIYELKEPGCFAHPFCETEWDSPWFHDEFFRGNTPPVYLQGHGMSDSGLRDGAFLGTFHTVQKTTQKLHHYDNGCYVFSAKPPFRVLRCARRTYLPAEAATEPHFRKAGLIQVCFPVGMVERDGKLLISYGDNDSSVKIMETTVKEMLTTTVELY